MDKKKDFFVQEAGLITGREENYIRTLKGYIGGVRINGIDIYSMKEMDKQMAMNAFGNSILAAEIPTKYVTIPCKPDYSSQIMYFARLEAKQKNPRLKEILVRNRDALDYMQKETTRKLSYVLFLAESTHVIERNMRRYVNCYRQLKISAVIIEKEELEKLFRIVLKGGDD